jgi:hypothetical protein
MRRRVTIGCIAGGVAVVAFGLLSASSRDRTGSVRLVLEPKHGRFSTTGYTISLTNAGRHTFVCGPVFIETWQAGQWQIAAQDDLLSHVEIPGGQSRTLPVSGRPPSNRWRVRVWGETIPTGFTLTAYRILNRMNGLSRGRLGTILGSSGPLGARHLCLMTEPISTEVPHGTAEPAKPGLDLPDHR